MSLRGDKYENAEEVRFRLEGTVVLYDGKPVYITKVNNTLGDDAFEIARVFFRPVPYEARDKETRKYLSSRKFSLEPFKMGYMNTDKEVVYLSRAPVRQQRQGLCQQNLSITDVFGDKSKNHDFSTVIRSKGFSDMVEGLYPCYDKALEMLRDRTSVALSNIFALAYDPDFSIMYLLNRGTKCGASFMGEKMRIPDKFKFLREEMNACNIPLG